MLLVTKLTEDVAVGRASARNAVCCPELRCNSGQVLFGYSEFVHMQTTCGEARVSSS